jgi:osmotically-inducible protein OsmY
MHAVTALRLAMLLAPLSGCAAAVGVPVVASALSPTSLAIGAGAVTGNAAMQDRGLGGTIDDNAIALAINQAWLQADPAIFRLIDTSVHQGRVLLTGSVRYPETRVEAVRLAFTAPGVREVLNEIQVTDQRRVLDGAGDLWITTQLRMRLVFSAKVNAVNFAIDTVNRTVYLMGVARDQAELEAVLALARRTAGVQDVVSHVRLRSEPLVARVPDAK